MVKTWRKTVLCFAATLLSAVCAGQDKTDTTYIRKTGFDSNLRIFLFNRFSSITVSRPDLDETRYMPDIIPGVGAGFTYKDLGLNLSTRLGFLMPDLKTGSFDIQMHLYHRKFAVDLLVSHYDGFYNEDRTIGDPDVLASTKAGFHTMYVFNWSRFSYGAAYNQSRIQVRSAGSLLLGGNFYYNRIKSDIPGFFHDDYSGLHRLDNWQIGPAAGYAYTWSIKKYWYVSASVTAGINLGYYPAVDRFAFFPSGAVKSAAGYNGERWSVNLIFTGNMTFLSRSPDRNIGLLSAEAFVSFVKRMNAAPKSRR